MELYVVHYNFVRSLLFTDRGCIVFISCVYLLNFFFSHTVYGASKPRGLWIIADPNCVAVLLDGWFILFWCWTIDHMFLALIVLEIGHYPMMWCNCLPFLYNPVTARSLYCFFFNHSSISAMLLMHVGSVDISCCVRGSFTGVFDSGRTPKGFGRSIIDARWLTASGTCSLPLWNVWQLA